MIKDILENLRVNGAVKIIISINDFQREHISFFRNGEELVIQSQLETFEIGEDNQIVSVTKELANPYESLTLILLADIKEEKKIEFYSFPSGVEEDSLFSNAMVYNEFFSIVSSMMDGLFYSRLYRKYDLVEEETELIMEKFLQWMQFYNDRTQKRRTYEEIALQWMKKLNRVRLEYFNYKLDHYYTLQRQRKELYFGL